MGKICSGERVLTPEELAVRAARVGSGLRSLGLGPGDGVAIYLRNDLAFFEAALGASSVGAYPIAINWHYTEDEARYVLEDSGAKAIAVHADLLAGIRGAIPDGVHVLVVRTPPEMLGAYRIPAELGEVPAGALDWDEWRERFAPLADDHASTTLSIIYTSGTTGHPKGVKRPAYSDEELERVAASLAVIFGLSYFEDPRQIVTAVVGPIYHSAPNAHAIFSLRAGASIHLMPRFDPERLLDLIEREGI